MKLGRAAAFLLFGAAACSGSAPAPAGPAAAPPPPAATQHSYRVVPMPAVATAAGSSVAWFASGTGMKGIRPDGQQLTLEGTPVLNGSNQSTGLRSADGGRVYVVAHGKLLVASTADARVLGSIDVGLYGRLVGALSTDAHWLWLAPAWDFNRLLLVDTQQGMLVASGSLTPGRRAGTGLLALPDGRLLLTQSGSNEILLISARGERVEVDARTSKASASHLSCGSPDGQTLHMVGDGTAAVGYCSFDGTVWWLDLARFEVTEHVVARIGNPFWGSPIVSPDGRLLYVFDQWAGYVTRIDLVERRPLRSTQAIRPGVAVRLPFIRDALAKGPNFSTALSADGETLFVTGSYDSRDGVFGIATSSLAVRDHWLKGRRITALWAGGEATALFAMEESTLAVLDPLTGKVLTVERGAPGGFAVA